MRWTEVDLCWVRCAVLPSRFGVHSVSLEQSCPHRARARGITSEGRRTSRAARPRAMVRPRPALPPGPTARAVEVTFLSPTHSHQRDTDRSRGSPVDASFSHSPRRTAQLPLSLLHAAKDQPMVRARTPATSNHPVPASQEARASPGAAHPRPVRASQRVPLDARPPVVCRAPAHGRKRAGPASARHSAECCVYPPSPRVV